MRLDGKTRIQDFQSLVIRGLLLGRDPAVGKKPVTYALQVSVYERF